MKIAIITDIHLGVRNDSQIMIDYFSQFYSDVFFPYLEENSISTVFDLGDTFDRRKYINYSTLFRSRDMLFDPLKERGIDVHILTGNHDTYFKGTNAVNALDLLLDSYPNIHRYQSSSTINIGGIDIAMLPWICNDNYKESMEFIESTKAEILCGHLEIAGFCMNRGSVALDGFDRKLFDKFDVVMSGHYHTRSNDGNIYYLGTPYEMTWADFDDPKGFHVFDTDTRELTFVRNPLTIYRKIEYSDIDKDMEDVLNIDNFHKNYVKINVKNKTNPYWFDLFMQKIEEQEPISVQVIEDIVKFGEEEEGWLDEAEDTLSLLKKYCELIEVSVDKKKLLKAMTDLYNEALEQE